MSIERSLDENDCNRRGRRGIMPERDQSNKNDRSERREARGMEGKSDRERARRSEITKKVQEMRQELLVMLSNKGVPLDAEAGIEMKAYEQCDYRYEEYVCLNEDLSRLRHFSSTPMRERDEEINERIKGIALKLGDISFLRFRDFLLMGEEKKRNSRILLNFKYVKL